MPVISSGEGKNLKEIYFEDWGNGKPLLFIHGWPLDHRMWEYQLTYFAAKGYRVIAYDRRGFGKSFKPWDGYDYNSLASDLHLILETLDLKEVTLIGFSMGGGEVVRYCNQYGTERIAKAILISTVLPFMLQTTDNPEGLPQEVFDGFIESILDDRPAFLVDFGKAFYGETLINHPVSQPYLDWSQSVGMLASPKATIDCITSFSGTDFRKDIAGLQIPVLIIHGDHDKTVPIEISSSRTAQLLPASTLKIYENAPHGLFHTHKDKLNEDIESFINPKSV